MSKPSKVMQVATFILYVVMGICIAVFIIPLRDFLFEILNNEAITAFVILSILFLLFLFSVFLQTIIHEAGHLVCGLISGYKFSSFRILSTCFVKTNEKIKVKKITVPGTVGQCLMLPPKQDLSANVPYKLYNYGGCIFNFASALVFVIIAFVFKYNVILYAIFGVLATAGMMLFFNNGIPKRTALIQNDGQNIIDIGKSQQSMQSYIIQLLIAEAQTKGLKLSEMPNEWFEMPNAEDLNNPLVTTRVSLICSRLIEQRDFFNAHITIRTLLQHKQSLLGIYKIFMELELIYLDAINFWASPTEISNRLSVQLKNVNAIKNSISVQRVLYTVEIVCRANEKEGQKHLQLFEKSAKKYPYQQEIEEERKLIALAQECAKKLKEQANA
ncbi:MAG: hypothetical protein IJW13_02010 [Clostridia bacterium]|nr:hypothetical protein [Clostridia bacterium]